MVATQPPAVDPAGLLCQSRDQKGWQGGRAAVGAAKGKHYFEATVTDEGLCRVGWSARSASLDLGAESSPGVITVSFGCLS